jgi:hypothetical protein
MEGEAMAGYVAQRTTHNGIAQRGYWPKPALFRRALREPPATMRPELLILIVFSSRAVMLKVAGRGAGARGSGHWRPSILSKDLRCHVKAEFFGEGRL